MLGKMLKYEVMITAHYFLPLFAGALLFSVIYRLFGNVFSNALNWISGLLIFFEIVLIIALAVMTVVITIQRFYKNLLGSEGYLMFTLPVSTHYNILSKLLIAMLWNIAALLITALSIFIMASYGNIAEIISGLWQSFYEALNMQGLNPILLLCEWIILGLLSVAGNILALYLAMSIGQLANVHKFMATFGAYVGIQFLLVIGTVILGSIMRKLPASFFHTLSRWFGSLSSVATIHLVTLIIGLATLAGGVIYYFITHWLLKHKLNLT